MQIILEICNKVISFDSSEPGSVLEAMSNAVYEDITSHYKEHPLVVLKERIDWDELVEACSGFRLYEEGKRGQPPSYSLRHLCGALIVRYFQGYSYRTTSAEMKGNGLVRYFVGYHLLSQVMSASTIRRFEEWVKENEPRLVFDEILGIIDEEFAEEREKKQYGDTFALYSRAAKQSRTSMLRDATRRLLKYLEAIYPEIAKQVCKPRRWTGIFGPDDALREECLPVEERKMLELRTAEATFPLLQALKEHEKKMVQVSDISHQLAEKWRAILAKILDDEFEFSIDKKSKVTAKRRTKDTKGRYKLGSTIDPEATFRKHGDKSDLGYNGNIATTDRFIREISAVTGATPDASGLDSLIREQKVHLGFVPSKMLYDQAAGYPKHFATVDRASNGQTQLLTRMINTSKQDKYGPMDFTQGEDGQLICPDGQVTTKVHRHSKNDGYEYRFSASQCQGCSLFHQCQGEKANPETNRTVYISDYAILHRDAIEYTKTPEGKEEYKERFHVERIIAGVVRYNGGRRARSYGTNNADFQAKMSGAAYNAKRFCKILSDRAKEATLARGSP